MSTDRPLRTVEVKTPVRLDLAGGTVDLWPLYLFFPGASTINMGIDLYAKTSITLKEGPPRVVLQSLDQKTSMEWKGHQNQGRAKVPAGLILHSLFLDYFLSHFAAPKGTLTISTQATSPAGAGLGGSSALSISLVCALALWFQSDKHSISDLDPQWVISLAQDTESRVLWGPAGLQDYYGAFFGGLQNLQWLPASHLRTPYSKTLTQELSQRITLFYSGQSRNSGINNWKLYQSVIAKDPKALKRFSGIVDATQSLHEALLGADWNKVGKAIQKEWDIRTGLAKSITTAPIAKAMKQAGPGSSYKICGAGGGGCFFVYHPSGDAKRKAKLIQNLTQMGMRHLPFQPVHEGAS